MKASTSWLHWAADVMRASRLAYAILDGTLTPYRLSQRPYGNGKHKAARNECAIAGQLRRLVGCGASLALPAAVHDVSAAWTVGLVNALTGIDVKTFADKGYKGAGGTIRTLFKGIAATPGLSRGQRGVNRAHSRVCAIGERAGATSKSWKVLTQLRCCPHRATTLAQAILVEEDRCSG